jgi:hypothetical protein
LFFRLLAEALAVRMAQGILKWLTSGPLRDLLAKILEKIGGRFKRLSA